MNQGLLDRYEELLREWAPRLDLVAPGDLPKLRERHIDDSLRLLPLLGQLPPGPCLDVGSGAGLPGLPLAICSDRRWILLEPRKRRAAFLEEVVRDLALECEVRTLRAEQAPDLHGGMALVTARALAPPEEALSICRPFAAPGGAAVVFVGASVPLPSGAQEWSDGIAIVRVRSTSP